MTNKKDNLKEKEIDREAPLKQDELENISGGWGEWFVIAMTWCTIDKNICTKIKCQKALCELACCHPGAVIANKDESSGTYTAAVDHNICTGCRDCLSKNACPKAITVIWGR